jgi:integrase
LSRGKKPLTALEVRTLKQPGRHSDGHRLYLNITRSGAKSWIFFYVRGGKQREMGLGSVATISLQEARAKAQDASRLLAQGVDPLAARKASTAARRGQETTLGECCDALLEQKKPSWRSNSYRLWRGSLALKHISSLRSKPVRDVGQDDILAAVAPLRTTAADSLRARLGAVLDQAIAEGLHAGPNPADKKMVTVLARKPRHIVTPRPAMPWRDVPGFVQGLRAGPLTLPKLALEFQILTATRPSESRQARWDEFDVDAALWTIAASRMKGRKSFRVPLSSRAVEILRTLADIRTAEWVFPNRSGTNALSPRPLNALLPSNVSAHGFRSSFRTWVADDPAERFSFDVAELALAHTIGGQVERSYLRGDGLLKRTALMQAWCDFLDGAPL